MKTYSITLTEDVAVRAEALAREASRSMSELVSDALRTYAEREAFANFEEIQRYAATRNPKGYTEEDIPRLLRETRDEMANETSVAGDTR